MIAAILTSVNFVVVIFVLFHLLDADFSAIILVYDAQWIQLGISC